MIILSRKQSYISVSAKNMSSLELHTSKFRQINVFIYFKLCTNSKALDVWTLEGGSCRDLTVFTLTCYSSVYKGISTKGFIIHSKHKDFKQDILFISIKLFFSCRLVKNVLH